MSKPTIRFPKLLRLLSLFASAILISIFPSVSHAQTLAGYILLTANVSSTATSATDATCPVGNKCFYYMTAIYPLGESGPSNVTSIIDVTTNGVKLTWTAPTTTGFTGYNIYRGVVGLPPSAVTGTAL